MEDLDFLYGWPPERVDALFRIAKRTGFFTDPRDMIRLRKIHRKIMKGEQS